MKRILITIPHYFNPNRAGKHSSLFSKPEDRAMTFATALSALLAFSNRQLMLSHRDRTAFDVNQKYQYDIKIVICLMKSFNLVKYLPMDRKLYSCLIVPEKANPKFMGFYCQQVLKQHLGQFDLYGFMEDDLIIRDPLFFSKLFWFAQNQPVDHVLFPHRYEMALRGPAHKTFVDGYLSDKPLKPFTKPAGPQNFTMNYGGEEIAFDRPSNPHSGCFFITNPQMEKWVQDPDFSKPTGAFISPLESSATLGIYKNFALYKPDFSNASFLEIQHNGSGYASQVGAEIPIDAAFRSMYGEKYKYL